MALLTDADVQKELGALPGWAREGKGIRKTYDCGGFRSALAFVNKVGELAERADHHPDILIEYRREGLECVTGTALNFFAPRQ
jgi:4a-hydroxytetrahydrobiopterin dehydratase